MLGDNVGTAKRNHYLSVIVTKKCFLSTSLLGYRIQILLIEIPKRYKARTGHKSHAR